MGWIQTEKKHRQMEPKISITKSDSFIFNVETMSRYCKEKRWVVIAWDSKKRKLRFKLLSKSTPNSYSISTHHDRKHRPDGIVNAKTLIKSLKVAGNIRYPVTFQNGFLYISY